VTDARVKRTFLALLLALLVELAAVVTVWAAGTVAALQFIEHMPGFEFAAWAAFTGIVTVLGFMFGSRWQSIKEWLF